MALLYNSHFSGIPPGMAVSGQEADHFVFRLLGLISGTVIHFNDEAPIVRKKSLIFHCGQAIF